MFHDHLFNCSLGKNGVISAQDKVEGDGHTPTGLYPLRSAWYRSDRLDKPFTVLNMVALTTVDGWCDDANDINYNKHVTLPYQASHEDLYRDDDLYNIITVIGYNDDPIINGKGSAIFMHVTDSYGPTAGCISLSVNDLQYVLANIDQDTNIVIKP